MPLTHYKSIDTVDVTALMKGDTFSYEGAVYEVAINDIIDDGSEVAIPVYDEMDDNDILWIPVDTRVSLLAIDD